MLPSLTKRDIQKTILSDELFILVIRISVIICNILISLQNILPNSVIRRLLWNDDNVYVSVNSVRMIMSGCFIRCFRWGRPEVCSTVQFGTCLLHLGRFILASRGMVAASGCVDTERTYLLRAVFLE
jgi:hypothetical protein